jgi:hypothetical protein
LQFWGGASHVQLFVLGMSYFDFEPITNLKIDTLKLSKIEIYIGRWNDSPLDHILYMKRSWRLNNKDLKKKKIVKTIFEEYV